MEYLLTIFNSPTNFVTIFLLNSSVIIWRKRLNIKMIFHVSPLFFIFFMKQAVSSDLLLYGDYSCLIFQHKHVIKIEKHLNNDFSNLCGWFLDNKLSIHFGEDKTKSILFGSKRKLKKVGKLNITYQGIDIKQNSQVTYLGCILDEIMSGEPMA